MLQRAAVLPFEEKYRPLRNGPINLMRLRNLKKIGLTSGDGTSGRVARALYLNDDPRDFGPEVAFSLCFASLSDT